ncbi:hypothetical protein ACQ4LE_004976 [Meloidogyne hapla]
MNYIFFKLFLFIYIIGYLVIAKNNKKDEKDDVFKNVIILTNKVLDFARPVALFEFANNHSMDHPEKEDAFLQRIDDKAGEIGLDKEFARLFFIDQINASKVVQAAYFNLWNKNGMPNEQVVDIHTTEFQTNMGKVTMNLAEALLPIVKYRDSKCGKETEKIAKELAKIDVSSEFKRDKAFGVALNHLCSNNPKYK